MKRNVTFLPSVALVLISIVMPSFAHAHAHAQTAHDLGNPEALSVSDITVSHTDARSVMIRWTTNKLADSRVEYGLTEHEGMQSELDQTRVFSHAIQLNHLVTDRIYFYRVVSNDQEGNIARSPQLVFAVSEISPEPGPLASAVFTITDPKPYGSVMGHEVTFTYEMTGDAPPLERVPHVYLTVDVLQNGRWISGVRSFHVGSRNAGIASSGSFHETLSPGTYRIDGILGAYQPKHERVKGSRVQPFVFTVQNKDNDTRIASSSAGSLENPIGYQLKVGDRVRNIETTEVRQYPSKRASLIGAQSPKTKGTIVGKAIVVGNARWWNINYDVGYDGWSREDALLPLNAPLFDFALEIDGELARELTASHSVIQGSSVEFSVKARLISGKKQPVSFAVRGLPADTRGVFSAPVCVLNCVTVLSINTVRTAREGAYPIVITAISGQASKTVSLQLNIVRFVPVPAVSVQRDFPDTVVPGSIVRFSSRVHGDAKAFGAQKINFRIDNEPEMSDALLNGVHQLTHVPAGDHTLIGFLEDREGKKISGTDFAVFFTSDPSLASPARVSPKHITDTTASIVWETDKNSAGRIVYDNSPELRFSAPEVDAANKQKVHAVTLRNLLPCAIYFYRVLSKNTAGGESVSPLYHFYTTGCIGSAPPVGHAVTLISAAGGGSLELTRGERSVRADIPAYFSDDSTLVIEQLDSRVVVNAGMRPTAESRLVGEHAYRIVALKNPSASIFSFPGDLMLTMRYTPEDIKNIMMGTLKIWRWTGVAWTETDRCMPAEKYAIRCMTDQLSTFGLFGEEKQSSVISRLSANR